MYTPKAFLEPSRSRLHDLIDAHSFGQLIAIGDDGAPEIAHVPFVLARDRGDHGELHLHVARANRIWRLATSGRPVVAVFSGPHGYVSPRWYERPREQVPTWNYAVVHAHGRVRGPLADAEVLDLLDRMAARYEQGAEPPWRLADIDGDLRDRLVQEIVGLTLVIERLEGKFKLSQNRSPADRARVLDALRARGLPDDLAMAELMTAGDGRRGA